MALPVGAKGSRRSPRDRIEVVCTNVVYVLFLSLAAYVCDLKSKKIPNTLIVMGYATGLMYVICEKGPSGIPDAVISAAWPILLLFFLFRIRAMGAGDIKLFSVSSLFLDHHQMFTIIYLSLLIGAAVGVFRLAKDHQIVSHLKNFQYYAQTVITNRKISYYQNSNEGIGILHFAGCIFAAVGVICIREVLVFYGLF